MMTTGKIQLTTETISPDKDLNKILSPEIEIMKIKTELSKI